MERGSASAFHLICPDLLDCIVEKAASGDSPSTLEHLEGVNRAFRASAQRCSRTLVICSPGKKRGLKPQQACECLSKEVGMRPKLSTLVVRNGASAAGIWAAVSPIQWTSIIRGYVHVEGPSWVRDYISSISVARTSLRTIDLNVGSSIFDLDRDICRLVQAFPKLEELTLREARAGNGICYRRPKEQAFDADADGSSLTSLDILRSSILSKNDIRKFGSQKHLTVLRSLKFRCCPI
jgi:hypothetical protein